jgi:hypothetical protein
MLNLTCMYDDIRLIVKYKYRYVFEKLVRCPEKRPERRDQREEMSGD